MSAATAAGPTSPVSLTGPPGSGAVAAGSREVVEAALSVLGRGGSAVDAAVAGAMAAVMAEPVLASLGGGGFLLVDPLDGPPVALDFFVDVPGRDPRQPAQPDVRTVVVDFARTGSAAGSSEQVFHGGWGTVAVPGCLDGLLQAHERFGRLEWPEVVAPAIHLARAGVEISAGQKVFLNLVADLLNLTPESRAIFAEVERTGRYVNGPYADLLEAVAARVIGGVASPAFAEPLLAASARRGGVLTPADLAGYRVALRDPLVAHRGGARVWTNPPPSVGGSIVIEALNAIERTPGRIAPAVEIDALVEATSAQRRRGTVSKGTTHLSVVDGEGQLAALTLSNGSGSGTVVAEWGVALNNMLGEEDLRPPDGHDLRPGERMGSMMAPTLGADAQGSRFALGTGGSERIRSAVLSVLLRVLDEGLSLRDAVAAPRVHASEAGPVHVEPGWSPDDLDALTALARRRGWAAVEQWSAANLFFGGVHAVAIDADGSVQAVGDSRRTGSVGILEPDGTIALA